MILILLQHLILNPIRGHDLKSGQKSGDRRRRGRAGKRGAARARGSRSI